MQKSIKKIKKQSSFVSQNAVIDAFIKTQIFALIVGFFIFVTVCLIAYFTDLITKHDYYVSLLAFSSISFLTGFYSGIKIRNKGLITGIVFSVPIITLFLIISLALNGFKADYNILYSVVSMFVFASAGGIFAVNKRLK